MSLINQLLENKLIIVMVGIAGLLILAAVQISLLSAIRARLDKRARRKKAERARLLAAKRRRAALRAAELASENAPAETTEQAVATDDAAQSETPAENEEAETAEASEIQTLLADVFIDEEDAARFEALLANVRPIAIDELLLLNEKIREHMALPDASQADETEKAS